MKKDGTVNGKEKKQYRKLISEKLKSMGIEDSSTLVRSAIKRYAFTNNDGTKEIREVEKFTAKNNNRNLVKRLSKLPIKAIAAFLNSKPQEQQPTVAPEVTLATVNALDAVTEEKAPVNG
jgi:hypothetical protein